ncbi:hypothetical protein P43SY_011592 [Pythium insidiosum]|uniref:ABC transporter domain-containing protein n=1 Tax=Pythium insidiosum TaxID=114742 RepID=A0AAD5L8S9_PYTIN|nr:hypothetical protein P43SY_011592 [Pythium insidiosum]
MFRELDAQLKRLRVLSYGISVTTMEEVFIKVAEASDEDQQHTLHNKVKRHDADRGSTDASTSSYAKQNVREDAISRRSGSMGSLFGVQFGALLQKRFRIATRDKRFLLPEHNSKHQQLVSGVNLVAFWLANYVWDLLIYCIPGGVALILIQAYDLAALTGSSECLGCGSNTFTAVIVLFVLFGFAICPYSYCWSFVFREHASAQTKMILINFLVGLGFLIASFVPDVINNDTATDVNRVLKWLYRLSPIYCLCNDAFDLNNAGYEIIFLVIDAILYLVLAVVIDYALTFPKAKAMIAADPQIEVAKETEDEDVAAEAERVACGGADQDVIRLERLRKVYKDGQKVAVKNLSFGLKRGECFGFLGINGAGKTTTMKMLTGDIVPTSGGATLSGFDILTQQLEVRREIGYCPQFDALIDLRWNN